MSSPQVLRSAWRGVPWPWAPARHPRSQSYATVSIDRVIYHKAEIHHSVGKLGN
jgi:hypothetical protein